MHSSGAGAGRRPKQEEELAPARRDDGAAKLLGAERGWRKRRRWKRKRKPSVRLSGVSRHSRGSDY